MVMIDHPLQGTPSVHFFPSGGHERLATCRFDVHRGRLRPSRIFSVLLSLLLYGRRYRRSGFGSNLRVTTLTRRKLDMGMPGLSIPPDKKVLESYTVRHTIHILPTLTEVYPTEHLCLLPPPLPEFPRGPIRTRRTVPSQLLKEYFQLSSKFRLPLILILSDLVVHRYTRGLERKQRSEYRSEGVEKYNPPSPTRRKFR